MLRRALCLLESLCPAWLRGPCPVIHGTGSKAAGIPLGYLARLQRAFTPGQPADDPGRSGIIDPLTARELEVPEPA